MGFSSQKRRLRKTYVSIIDGLRWSDPATWGGILPTAGDAVTISAGQTIILDTAAVAASVNIAGTLRADTTASAISLTTGYINVGASGLFEIGTESVPYPANKTATITLNGAEASRATRTVSGAAQGFTNDGVGRSLQVQPGGKLSFIGEAPTIKRTRLNAHAASAATSFTLADTTGWLSGDEIVVGPSDFYGTASGASQKLTLSANASGTGISTTTGISAARWGVMQYVTDSGMATSAGTLTSPPSGTATTLDERAMVINLRRNIIVQGANDSAWATNKFGAHCMFMGRTSDIKMDGVRFNRVGQAGAIGRYPFHWHMMSWNMPSGMNAPSDGAYLGLALNSQYMKNCAVVESSQRMVTIHGTSGVTVSGNVGFDITGHAIFLEEGSEEQNTITNNVVMKVRTPTSGNRLLNSDIPTEAAYDAPNIDQPFGTSGVWFTNPNNTLTGNWVADCQGTGIWNAFAASCFGLSINTGVTPNTRVPLSWADNIACACGGTGAQTNFPPINARGDIQSDRYNTGFVDNPLLNLTSYKNNSGGYSNRINSGRYVGFICADNGGQDIFGQATITNSSADSVLMVAESLNNATSKYTSTKRAGFASYHEILMFPNLMAVGYGWQDGVQIANNQSPIGGGLMRTWDLYTQATFRFDRSTGVKLINCPAPFRTLPPILDGYPMQIGVSAQYRNWSIAGVIHDINGLFVPAGNYWIFDNTFLTYGASGLTNVAPSGSNGKYTPDRFFGIQDFNHNADNFTDFYCGLAMTAIREDTGGTQVGEWVVPDGSLAPFFGGMRHFAAAKSGRYRLTFPGNVPSSFISFNLMDMTDTNDIFLLGIPFTGASPKVYMKAGYQGLPKNGSNAPTSPGNTSTSRVLTSTGSMANVVADTTGTIFFNDTGTNTVWFQVKTASLTTGQSDPYKPIEIGVSTV